MNYMYELHHYEVSSFPQELTQIDILTVLHITFTKASKCTRTFWDILRLLLADLNCFLDEIEKPKAKKLPIIYIFEVLKSNFQNLNLPKKK